MADNDKLYIEASLNIKQTFANVIKDIDELNKMLQGNNGKYVEILGKLDISKTTKLIQSQMLSLSKGLKLDIGKNLSVDTAPTIKKINAIVSAEKNMEQETRSIGNSLKNSLNIGKLASIPNEIKKVSANISEASKYVEDYFSRFGEVSRVENSSLGDDSTRKLKNFTIQVKSATGEVEKFRYVYNKKDDNFYLKNINSADEGVNRLIQSNKKLNSQIDSTTIKLNQQLKQTQALYTDKNSKKYVTDNAQLASLSKQYNVAQSAINNLKNADNITMKQLKANAEVQIQELKRLIDSYYNVTHAATTLRTKDINTIKSDENNNLSKFIAQINNLKASDPILKLLKNDIENVKKSLVNVTDKNSLTSYLDKFSNLQSKANSLKEIFRGFGNNNWFSSNREQIDSISDISTKAKIYQTELQRISELWESQGIKVDKIKEKSAALSRAILNIKSPDTFEKWVKDFDTLRVSAEKVNINLQKQAEIQNQIYAYESKLATLKITPEKNTEQIALTENKLNAAKQNLSNLQMQSNVYKNLISLEEQEKIIVETTAKAREKYNDIIAKSNDKLSNKNNVNSRNIERQAQSIENYKSKIEKLIYTIKAWQSANNKAMVSNINLSSTNGNTVSDYTSRLINDLNKIQNSTNLTEKELKQAFNTANRGFASMKAETKSLGLAGNTFWGKIKDSAKKFSNWMSLTYLIASAARKVREAVSELKELDTILTEISKTSDMTGEQLKKLGDNSFDTASKYGQKASDYLLGVQEMNRAGFQGEQGTQMAELSTLAQSAGDMSAELANQYLIATNAAYKLGGSAEELNKILNSQNYITNHNALSMSDLAEATKIAGSQFALSGIQTDQMTAMLGTMIATTQQGGEVAARAAKGILMNLQQVKATADDIGDGGEDITAESLTKYEKACADLGVSLKEVKNGVTSLRDPMVILEELANSVSKEAQGSVKVANLINSVGGKYRGSQLSALLQNWGIYKKMLSEYNSDNAVGSAMEEAEKTANSFEGQLNRLSNTWVDFVNSATGVDLFKSFVNSGEKLINTLSEAAPEIKTVLNLFGDVLGAVTAIVDKIGLIPTIAAGLSFKNVGRSKKILLTRYADCA